MSRILVINPNSSLACTRAIEHDLARSRQRGGPVVDVTQAVGGPQAILSWQDWHDVAGPLCRLVRQEAADAYVIACASDPGLEAVREVTGQPVFGAFRCAVAASLSRGDRFGVVTITEAYGKRRRLAIRAMGLERQFAGDSALNVSLEALLDPVAARGLLIDAAMDLVQAGADVVVLGCTGMAAYCEPVAVAAGVPIIDPCQAGVAMARLAVATL